MKELFRRLQHWFQRDRFDREMEEEIRDHLARKTADGATADEARRRFGNVTSTMERSREAWSWLWLDQLSQDVRYALRTMSANRMFTAMAVTSLALGIGANTAIYSFMDAILVRSLPVDRPEQLVILNLTTKKEPPVVHSHWGSSYDEPGGGSISPNFPFPSLKLLREANSGLSQLFGYVRVYNLNFVADQRAAIVNSECVTGSYFGGLGVPAVQGRLLGPEDDRPGAPAVAMLSYEYWQSRFGGDPGVVGKAVTINNAPATIVGVSAPEFYGVSPESKSDLFVPMAFLGVLRPQDDENLFTDGHYYWVEMMGRLKPGATLGSVQAQLEGPFRNYVASTATTDRERSEYPALKLVPGGSGVDSIRRRFSKTLWVLMGMVGLILLIACANVANMQTARAASRRRELAVRMGLGAGRFRVIRQLLTESVMLALAGGIAGIGVAAAGIRLLLPMMANGDDDLAIHVGLDWHVLGFTLLVAVATGIAFGLAPAIQTTRVDLTPALKEARASDTRGGLLHLGRLRFGLSHLLVSAQIALSLLLVVGAGLFVRTLTNLYSVSTGFNTGNLLVFNLNANRAGFKGTALKDFYIQLQTRLQALPGIAGATSTDMPMVAGSSSRTSIEIPGIPKPPEGQRGPNTSYARVGTAFFETMQMPIIAGRALDEHDTANSPAVAVVNQVFAEKYFPGQNPIGRHFGFGGPRTHIEVEIVGVAANARYNSLKGQIPPVTFLPWVQAPETAGLSRLYFEIRTRGDALKLANTVREVVREASPLVPVQGITTQKQNIDRTIWQQLAFAKLATCFGALALLMACVGLYGTMAYSVARRTNEIGIRMALGAERDTIVWMVLREVLALCAAGAVIGAAAVYKGTALVESFLFDMKRNDPMALTLAAAVLFGCALLAGFLPARRASKIDPMAALRHE